VVATQLITELQHDAINTCSSSPGAVLVEVLHADVAVVDGASINRGCSSVYVLPVLASIHSLLSHQPRQSSSV
jgi:hypothetical protein